MNRLSSTAIILVALACAALVGAGAGAGSGAGEVKFAEGPALLEARSGACAALLADGRVLIAGGEAYGLALATLEIYDPATGRFEPVPGAMSTPPPCSPTGAC